MQEKDEWLQLPYEIAHGVVRTLTKHTFDYLASKKKFEDSLNDDPEKKKPATTNLEIRYRKLQHVDLYMIFNRRTGQVATHDWVRKHIVADSSGKPVLKKAESKLKPWVMTLRVDLDPDHSSIGLRSCNNGEFKEVRCFDLQNQCEKTKLAQLADGYAHLLRPEAGSDDEDQHKET